MQYHDIEHDIVIFRKAWIRLSPAATGTVVDDVKTKVSHSVRVKAEALCFKTSAYVNNDINYSDEMPNVPNMPNMQDITTWHYPLLVGCAQ